MPEPWEDGFNWIVPLRRAAVTAEVNYRQVMNAWQLALSNEPYKEKMLAWYDLDGAKYDKEVERLADWPCVFLEDDPHPVAVEARFLYEEEGELDAGNTVDTASGYYFVRLWKGPVRVLREAASPDEAQQLNEKKEVATTNGSTTFYAGDVIEYPLFKFLRMCGKDQYADIDFNPDGSFLLGTSLYELSDLSSPPAAGYRIHDNLLGMKFQLMLDLAVGIYYRRGGVQGVGFSRDINGQTYSSRGMIYGGSLAHPMARHLLRRADSTDVWAVCTNSWASGRSPDPPPTPLPDPVPDPWPWALGHPYNLPTPSSISSWNASHLLTSGWACSPCTLFLTQYMFEVRTGYGSNAVGIVMNSTPPAGQTRPLQDHLIKRYDSRGEPSAPENPREVIENADITVLSLTAHEKSIVRLFPPQKLMGEENLPQHGFMSGYDPLTGEACVEGTDELIRSGKIYFFEATGSLGRWRYKPGTHEYSVFGANRFNWREVESGDDVFPDNLSCLFTSRDDALANHSEATANLKPIVLYDKRGALLPSNYAELYAERAIPFPSMDEISGKFVTISSANSAITTARQRVQHQPQLPPGGIAPNANYQRLLS